jgi:oxygen-independent coproporphyrinogen-3 oxidase
MEPKEFGIYIHIPFCKRKCYYCDFISYQGKEELVERYIESICLEIENWKKSINVKQYNITTIYIGGGTPSYIEPKHIAQILKCLDEFINKNVEITIEINPGTVINSKLEKYKEAGINRLSIGLQETHEELLKTIGRIHNYEEFLNTYNWARGAGFKNINIDLMIGLPNQTIQDIKENLEKILKLKPEHISVYSLILEEGTNLEKQIEQGQLILPDEDIERNMYWYVKNALEKSGFNHYEISNFAKENKESKHNMNCWNQQQYRGFGIAAHSYVEGLRFSNTTNLEEYIDNAFNGDFRKNIRVHERQNEECMKKEYMLLGLRKLEGISITEFKNKYKENPLFLYKRELNELVQEKLIIIGGDRIKLTNKGLDLANQVWEKFV